MDKEWTMDVALDVLNRHYEAFQVIGHDDGTVMMQLTRGFARYTADEVYVLAQRAIDADHAARTMVDAHPATGADDARATAAQHKAWVVMAMGGVMFVVVLAIVILGLLNR